MKASEYNISSEKFVFVNDKNKLKDKELSTKPVGYFKDAFNRFKRNKASIVAAIIIAILVLYAIIAPIISPYKVSTNDTYFQYTMPKNSLFANMGINFWDGCSKEELNEQMYTYYSAIGQETGQEVIKNGKYKIVIRENLGKKKIKYYQVRLDSYHKAGVVYKNISLEEYELLQKYQNETNIQVIYPITERALRPNTPQDENDANFWYLTEEKNGKITPVLDSNKKLQNIYKSYTGADGYNSIRIDGDNNKYDYALKNQTGYQVRVNYYEYYIFNHSYVLQDGIDKPSFLFGTTNSGQDIFTCLASGARFSFILAIVVATVNLVVGAIYGAIEGYYGGKIDLLMERFVDVLSAVPFMIVITLLKYHMPGSNQVLVLFIAFFLTGWIGMAGRTRMQFYRFKNQEYVLAARTLGASDKRIMFKHIFPNALGTLITSCVLIIPSMIFSETSLTYLNIINLNTGDRTSVGTLLANAQPFLVSYPHMVMFPAAFISLLMLSFNLFGNGLRDAFNPSLRGTED